VCCETHYALTPESGRMGRKTSPVRIFLSYSHVDEKYRDKLYEHFSNLRRQNLIAPWHDRMIKPGDGWKGKINSYIDKSDMLIFLKFLHILILIIAMTLKCGSCPMQLELPGRRSTRATTRCGR